MMMGRFVKVCRRGVLRVNVDKSKVMALDEENGSVCEVLVDRTRLEYLSEFKYLDYVLDALGTDDAEVASVRKVTGNIRPLVTGDVVSLQLVCARVLDEALFMPVLARQ